MKIQRQNGIDGNKKVLYNLTQVQDGSIADMIGQRVGVKAYVLYEMDGRDGEPITVFKCLTDDGEILGTVSPAFIRGLTDFLDIMETDELEGFEVVAKVSKAGRKYITFKA